MSAKKKRKPGKKREFRFLILPKMPYPIRLILVFSLIAAGLYLQLINHLIIGFFVILFGALLGAVRTIAYEPRRKRGKTDWVEVLPAQWDHALDLIKKGKRWRRHFTNLASWPVFLWPLFIVGFVLFMVFFEDIFPTDFEIFLVFGADIIAVFGPVLLFGYLTTWKPPGLDVKLKALKRVIEAIEKAAQPDLMPMPMMAVMKSKSKKEGGGVPKDARMMIRFKGAPKEFYGVQVQVSLNTVSGTTYPYLYAVILFSKEFRADIKKIKLPSYPKLVLEPSKEGDVVVLVLRQKTTRTSGYHTNPRVQSEIVWNAINLARGLL